MTVATHWYLLDEMTRARRATLESEKAKATLAATLPRSASLGSLSLDGVAAACVALLGLVAGQQSGM